MDRTSLRRWMAGTSVLALATGMAMPAAAADKISLGLGGYFQFFGVVADQDDGAGEPGAGVREHGVARESEIHFSGKTTLDNGIEVGVRVELEGETVGDQIDESYIWFEGGFGRVELGSEDPAADAMFYGAPTPIAGHGVNSPNMFHASSGANAVGTSTTFVGIAGDSDKVTYFTPRFHGFQFGISYTPDATQEIGAGLRPDVTPAGATPQQSEAFEGAVNWEGTIVGVDIGAYAAYSVADVEGAAPGTGPLVGFEDQEMWGAGASLSYMGFTLGGSYRWTDQGLSGSNTDRWDANIGLVYAWSAWSLGAAYGHGEVEVGPGAGEDELDMIEVGFIYNLGPGIDISGGVQFVDYDSDTGGPAAENDAVLGLLGTSISF
ncbi:MAG: porin [Alphaproteobacteria bacterium]